MFMGCTTFGHQFNLGGINNIEIGKTTESEVVSMLGPPSSTQRLDNGIIVYEYAYGKRWLFNGTRYDYLQVQFYNGVVINKYPRLTYFG
jgi:hypothetical protein